MNVGSDVSEIFLDKNAVEPAASVLLSTGSKFLTDTPVVILPQGSYMLHVALSASSLVSVTFAEPGSVNISDIATSETATQYIGWHSIVVTGGNVVDRTLGLSIVTTTETLANFYWNLIRV